MYSKVQKLASTPPRRRPPKWPVGLVTSVVLVLVGCQIVPQPSIPAPRLASGSSATNSAGGQQGSVEVAGATAANSAVTTATVQRTTKQSSLQLSGRVAPSRTAVLTLRGSGTVSGVDVSPGQSVSQGTPLVEFTLDDASLQAARMQAQTAELTYETERDKLATLQAGASPDAVQQQRAVIARDQAEIDGIQQAQTAAQAGVENAGAARAAAQDAANRKVALAQVALNAAQDALSAAQATAQRSQQAADAAQAAQVQAQADAKDQAAQALTAANASLRAAQRQAQQAQIKLDEAKMLWNTTKQNQAIETQQMKLNQDNDALKAAKAAQGNATNGAQHAAADAAAEAAQSTITGDNLEMQHMQTNLEAAKKQDQDAVTLANLDLQAANDALAQAQTVQQQAQQHVDRLSKQSAPAGSSPNGQQSQIGQLSDPDAAQGAVAQAQHAVETQTLQLQDAQAAADAVAAGGTQAANTPSGLTLSAAQAQLQADQTKLDQLTSGTPDTALKTEQARVDALQQQAHAAAAAAQPTVQLTAPFDGTVAEVGVSIGQAVAPLPSTVDSNTTTSVTSAGQTSDGRPVAVRLVANGGSPVIADVQESDVAQLQVGQSVNVSFPGVPGQPIAGTLGDIASTANPRTTADTPVTYPVRVDVPSLPDGVRIGMSADIDAGQSNGPDVLTVPMTAVRNNNGRTVVTVIDGSGQSHDAPVQVGRSIGTDIQIVSGVSEGETVAVYQPPTVASQKQP